MVSPSILTRMSFWLLPTTLVGCSAPDDRPGAVTAEEARQLDDAAAMLDANSVDLNALAATNQDDPAP